MTNINISVESVTYECVSVCATDIPEVISCLRVGGVSDCYVTVLCECECVTYVCVWWDS